MNKRSIVIKWRYAIVLGLALLLLALSGTWALAEDEPPAPLEIVSAGYLHTCALRPSGAVDCWGRNNYGEAEDKTGPYTQVSAGEYYTCALTPSGAVDCWGYNYFGQATDQPGPYTQVSVGYSHTCALTPSGAVDCWGDNSFGQATDQPGPYTQVSAGLFHTCALTPSGAVDCWGGNQRFQADDQTGPYTQVSAGYFHTCALGPSGAVHCWGAGKTNTGSFPNYGQAVDQPGPYTQVSAGYSHTCALRPSGAVDCWGDNYYGQAVPPEGAFTQVSAGRYYHACALTPSGAVDCWGANLDGMSDDQPGPYGSYGLPPIANPGGPYLGAINTAITFDGSGSSDPDGDPLSSAWTFGDGITGTGAMPAHAYAAAGIYNACLTVNDGTVDSAPACTLAVVYDPSAGFVTGGGWIDSPVGAYVPDPSLSGKASFGFVSKYLKGASVPSGNTEFQFHAGSFAFRSTSYDWLVVSKDQLTAQFKGSGTVNGALDPNGNAYKFMLWAGDGSPDTFRIRIWWEDADGIENVVYDNGFNQAMSGGSIVVHTGK